MMHEPNLNLLDDLIDIMDDPMTTEAEWREANFRFLEEVDPNFRRPWAFTLWLRRCSTYIRWHLGLWRPPS